MKDVLRRVSIISSVVFFSACGSGKSDEKKTYVMNSLPSSCTEMTLTAEQANKMQEFAEEEGRTFVVEEGSCPESYRFNNQESEISANLLGRCKWDDLSQVYYDKQYYSDDLYFDMTLEEAQETCKNSTLDNKAGTWVGME